MPLGRQHVTFLRLFSNSMPEPDACSRDSLSLHGWHNISCDEAKSVCAKDGPLQDRKARMTTEQTYANGLKKANVGKRMQSHQQLDSCLACFRVGEQGDGNNHWAVVHRVMRHQELVCRLYVSHAVGGV